MRTGSIAAVLLLLTAACAEQIAETAFPNRATVHHPEALFDVSARSALLRRNDGSTGEPRGARACPRPEDLAAIEPLVGPSIHAMDRGSSRRAARDYTRALNTRAYRLLLDQDMARAARDIATLRSHAEQDAWLAAKPNDGIARATVNAMGPLLPAWQILRQSSAATDQDRALIDAWLQRISLVADAYGGQDSTATFRGANDMLLGLMLGDTARYNKGLRGGYYAQIAALRPDGSFPMETDRGVTALENTSRNISLMVYSAQIAASQGTDLYTVQINDRGLDDAIGFLLRANADNSLVDGYAAANREPSEEHPVFSPGSQVNPFGSPSRGWVMLYTMRFRRSPLSEELLSKVELRRRISNDTVGGVVTCYAARI